MYRRIIVLVTITSLAWIVPSQAENAPAKVDPLKKYLEEKDAQTKSKTQKPLIYDKKDLQPNAPKPPAQPNRTEQLAPPPRLSIANESTAVGTKPRSALLRFSDSRIDNGVILAATDGARGARFDAPNAPARTQSSSPSENLIVAQTQKAPRYAIQFKQGTTPAQVENLLKKYRVHLVKSNPNLNIVVVESDQPTGSLTDLNPPIIQNLRREQIVANAFVDVPVGTRSVPQSGNAIIKGETYDFAWLWRSSPISAAAPIVASTSNQPPPQTQPQDGSWGLKAIRVPVVWTIIQRYRAANPNLVRPRLAIVDRGFAKHEDLNFNLVSSADEAATNDLMARLANTCDNAHGNHIAGIVGATFNNGIGIDGILRVDGKNSQSNVDAVLWQDSLILDADPAADHQFTRTVAISETIDALTDYLSANPDLATKPAKQRIVVNMSQGTNFITRPVLEGDDPEKTPGAKEHMQATAGSLAAFLVKYEDSVLIVVAAGNDSTERTPPLHTKWSHPLNWLVTGEFPVNIRRPKNIIIVEAYDRTGERADFSNIGGHVSAPGVDILSTLWQRDNPYSACRGTSMAAPHVAAVAALMFELEPSKKASDIAEIIKASAIKPSKAPGTQAGPGAPRFDALEAVLRLPQNNTLTRLADLNRDGKVDIEDMKIFAEHFALIEDNRKNGTPFTKDLNDDGVVDANECNWPLIDFNGSGSASLALTDAKLVQGLYRTDLDVMALAWTDKAKDFKTALKETGFDVTLQAAETAPATAASQGCK